MPHDEKVKNAKIQYTVEIDNLQNQYTAAGKRLSKACTDDEI